MRGGTLHSILGPNQRAILGAMSVEHVYRTIDRLKCRALWRWNFETRYGGTPEAETARLRYNSLVDLSNDWTRALARHQYP